MKLDKSRELYERSMRSLAGGVSSNIRLSELPVPLFFERAKGSRIYDVDGNEYIDYVMGLGPVLFGHAPNFLTEAVTHGMQTGQIFSGQHELEIRVSEMIQKVVPSAELVRYAASGTEAVQVALRVARAYTGRPKFIKFEGQYHGWMDSVAYSMAGAPLEQLGLYDSPNAVPGSAGLGPGTAEEVVVLPWNDIDVLRKALDRHHNEIAAILTEPITSCIMPEPGYLEEMRTLCDERGIALIFDEVITGFRVALGGAQELLGVTPDLSTFAKAMAGGFPIAMVTGKQNMMGLMEDNTVLHAGTLNSNIISMSAAEASLRKLMENDRAVYKQLYSTGTALMEGLRDQARKHEIEVLVYGLGPVFALAFTTAEKFTSYRDYRSNADEEKYARFRQGMLERGIRLPSHSLWFLSTAHTDDDVSQTIAAADETFSSL